MNDEIPTFTAPAPTFVPPTQPSGHGNSCHYHQNEPAVAKCARCGKPICQDCADNYQVAIGEYQGQSLCYDCWQEIVADNVKELKKQRRKIIFNYIFTFLGMLVGFILAKSLYAEAGNESALIPIIGAFVGGCLWTFVCNVFRVLGACLKLIGEDNWLGAIFGFIIGIIKSLILAIWGTIRKLFYYTKYIIKTSGFIKSDTNGLAQMRDYMEYTLVRSRNVGVDLASLMNEGSELYNNSYAQSVLNNGEENAENMFRNSVVSVNENGEIIRSFVA